MSDQDQTSLPTISDSIKDTMAMSGPTTPKEKQEPIVSIGKKCQIHHDHPCGLTPVVNDHPVEDFGDVKVLFKASKPPFLIRQIKTPPPQRGFPYWARRHNLRHFTKGTGGIPSMGLIL